MRKILMAMFVAAMLPMVFGCTKTTTKNPSLTLVSETVTATAEGGSFEILYNLENPVEGGVISATTEDSWISDINCETESKVTFKVAVNETTDAREGAVAVVYTYSGKEIKQTVKVSQAASDGTTPIIKPESDEVYAFEDGGAYEINYTIVNPFDGGVVSASCEADWISNVDASTENVIKFDVKKNIKAEERVAPVVITYTYAEGVKSIDVNVRQQASSNPSDYDFEMEAGVFDGLYYAGRWNPNAANYWLILSDNGYTSNGYVKNSSNYFRLDIFGEFPEDEEKIEIPEGTYVLETNSAHNKGTINAGMSAYIYTDDQGNVYDETYTEATLTVKREGNEYVFDLIATTDEGRTCHVTYTGAQLFEDKSDEGGTGPADGSTITEDYAANFAGSGSAHFWGDNLGNNTGYWVLDVVPHEAGYDGFALSLYSASVDYGDFPTGTFTVSDSYTANTIAPGSISGNTLSGSALHIYLLQGYITGFALFHEGEVTISKEGSTYSIDFNVKDENGHKVTGKWSGKISSINESSAMRKCPESKTVNM